MKLVKWVMVSCFLFSGFASALTPEQEARIKQMTDVSTRGAEVIREAEVRGISRCDVQQMVVSKPDWDAGSKSEKNVDVTLTFDWSGGCTNGLRDGEGVLKVVEQNTDTTRWPGGGVYKAISVKETTSQGRIVKGKRLGLWCEEWISRLTVDGDVHKNFLSYCSVLGGPATTLYQKQADGSWRQYNGTTTLSPGTLEAQSAQVLAAAAGGVDAQPAAPVALVGKNQMLDDLVAGARIVLAPSKEKIDLQGKRVVVVLSSATIAEMERFRREREALINSSTGLTGRAAQQRARFIAASDPERLLVNVAKVLRTKNAGLVQAADDLAGLQQGKFDYALVIDWKSRARLDLLGKFDSFPVSDGSTVACPSFGYFVIDSQLRGISSYDSQNQCIRHTRFLVRGDEGYMGLLVDSFEYNLGKNIDDVGQMKALAYPFTP